jgi:hypothetical protein
MAKKPKKPDSRNEYRAVRIRIQLAPLAEAQAGKMAQDFTQWVNDAVRMRLEADGVWPPKPPAPT